MCSDLYAHFLLELGPACHPCACAWGALGSTIVDDGIDTTYTSLYTTIPKAEVAKMILTTPPGTYLHS